MRIINLPGLTIDLHGVTIDDSNFDPKDHPQAPAGSSKGGQFVKKGYSTASPAAGKNAVIRQAHKIASSNEPPEKIADKLKQLAASQKAPIVASYANKLLSEIEEEHSLKKGQLGKAYPKSDENNKTEEKIENTKPEKIENTTENLSPKISQEKIPLPHPHSSIQKKIYEDVNSANTLQEQIKAVKAIQIEKGDTYQEKYKKAVLSALGDKLGETSPENNPNKIVSKRPKDIALLQQINEAYDHKKSRDSKKLKEIIPTYSSFSNFTKDQKNALADYTGSSYHSINKALRDPLNATGVAVEHINNIDEAFDNPKAKITEDIITERGQELLASTLEKSDHAIEQMKKGLKIGIPVTFTPRGFQSTSIKEPFDGKIKFKILVKKGTPALFLDKISHHKGEAELLLKHGQPMQVLSYEKIGGRHVFTMATIPW